MKYVPKYYENIVLLLHTPFTKLCMENSTTDNLFTDMRRIEKTLFLK